MCDSLPDISNQDPSQTVASGTAVGDSVLYLCDTGFILNLAGTENECNNDGWSLSATAAALPTCDPGKLNESYF